MSAARRATVLAFAVLLSAAVQAASSTARITYLTGSSLYVDAGRDAGLKLDDRLEVVRDDEVIAVCRVSDLSAAKASCRIVERSADLVVGDRVVFAVADVPETRAPEPGSVSTPNRGPEAPARRRRRSGVLRGRVGVRYLTIADRTGSGMDYEQPALDLRLLGYQLAGSPWGIDVDVRSRRTVQNLSDGTRRTDGSTRAYRGAVSYQAADSPWSFKLGRQYSDAVAGVTLFDGVAGRYQRDGWATGLFSGTLPDDDSFELDGSVREHGGYVEFRGRRGNRARWSVSTGVIGSYEDSEVSREFFYVQGRYSGPRIRAYINQEVDYNRDWKADVEDDTVDPTSTFASLYVRISDAWTVSGGFDNRRNVRLYRDFISPETEFDDSFRRGAWAAVAVRIQPRFNLRLDARTRGGGSAGDGEAYTANFGMRDLTGVRLDVNLRASRYESELIEGWLYSLDAGAPLTERIRLQLSGGLREEKLFSGLITEESLIWYTVDLDIALGRRWYLILSADRTDGDFEEVDQLYTTLTYRF